jgi:hypothetical protein
MLHRKKRTSPWGLMNLQDTELLHAVIDPTALNLSVIPSEFHTVAKFVIVNSSSNNKRKCFV